MSRKILIESFVIFCFFKLKLFPIVLRFSVEILSLHVVPVSEWVLGISSLFLIILLNHVGSHDEFYAPFQQSGTCGNSSKHNTR